MKLTKDAALFQVPFGSHLYGTSTPTSDLDAKIVALPDFEDLIMLRRIENTVVKPEGYVEGEKMKAGDIEFEIIPLQIFLDHFLQGQTYALEVAFAVLHDMHVVLEHSHGELANKRDNTFLQEWMTELVGRFLTRDVKKMVGYARSQSQLYGLKTERYNEMLSVKTFLEGLDLNARLSETPQAVQSLLEFKYVDETEIMNGQGGKVAVKGVEINGKQFPLSTTWKTILSSVKKTLEGYGNRVKDHTGEPTDWKALSHAIRIAEQIQDVLVHGEIKFPRPNAQFLLEVKQGKHDLKTATDILTELFNNVELGIAQSKLPEKTPELVTEFEQFKLKVLRHYYEL